MNELTSRYAEALYLLKKESNSLLETQQEIKELIKIIKDNPNFPVLLDSSYISKEERISTVDKVFVSVDEEIRNLVKVVIENNRALYLLGIFEDFNSLVNEYRGVKEGLVYSTEPIKEVELEKLTAAISKIENHPVELKNIIDPSLIGGVKVVINDHIYDGSLKHNLEQMKSALLNKEGNSYEN